MLSIREKILPYIARVGADPGDDADVKLQKSTLVAGSLMFIGTSIAWGILYLDLDLTVAGLIPFGYALVSTLSLIHFSVTHRFAIYSFIQLALIILLPYLLVLALGGYQDASVLILWALLAPLGAVLFAGRQRTWRWLAFYSSLLILSGLLEPFLGAEISVPASLNPLLLILNIATVLFIVFIPLDYFIGQKNEATRLLRVEKERSENLLLSILPAPIATRLKQDRGIIADSHDAISVLFIDLVDFTRLSTLLPPGEIIKMLNDLFSKLDSIVDKYQLEKIHTMGDSYMVASGLLVKRNDHAECLARAALEMMRCIDDMPVVGDSKLLCRMGISTGAVVAGVIGNNKLHYDIWGDPVNTASRMESLAAPGKIQISRATYQLISDKFECDYNGPIQVKGKGLMKTWSLVGEK